MKTGLLVFVLDIDTTSTLFVEKDLTKNEFEIILMHVLARTRYLIETKIRQVKRSAIIVARISGSIDVTTVLQSLYILLSTQYAGDIKLIMGQAIALQNISKALAYTLQLRSRCGHEVRDRMSQRMVGLDTLI